MHIQIFGKLIAEAGWNTGWNLLRDQNTGKFHDKSCFWAERAIETVKYFKYSKLYEFWLGNFASWFRVCTGGGKFCGETNLMLIDSWRKKTWKMNVLLIFLTFFRGRLTWQPATLLCALKWKAKRSFKVRWFLFFVSFRYPDSSCLLFNVFVSAWLIDRNKLSVHLHRWLLYSSVAPTNSQRSASRLHFFASHHHHNIIRSNWSQIITNLRHKKLRSLIFAFIDRQSDSVVIFFAA